LEDACGVEEFREIGPTVVAEMEREGAVDSGGPFQEFDGGFLISGEFGLAHTPRYTPVAGMGRAEAARTTGRTKTARKAINGARTHVGAIPLPDQSGADERRDW